MKKYMSIALLTGALLFSGCGDSDNFVFTNTNNVIAAPVCVDDAYATDQNAVLTVNTATGVLANDTPNGGTVTAFDAVGTQGGTVAMNADGSFSYTPVANFNGNDTFTYTLANGSGQVTCTVTITVNTIDGFFVDAVNGNDGTGSFTGGLPFQTIQAAVAAAPTNADIVVLPGNYTGTVNLLNGQRLLGSGSVLAQGATRPQLTGPVVLADGSTLDFVRVADTPATVGAGDGLGDSVIADGASNGTVTNCEIENSADEGISLVDIAGDWTISNNTITNPGGFGADFEALGTSTVTATVSNNQITDARGALGLLSGDNSTFIAFVTGNTFTNSVGVGSTLELNCTGDSDFCLDLETNTASPTTNAFDLFDNPFGSSSLSVEQLSVLTVAQPAGAGNVGDVDFSLGDMPTELDDGDCVNFLIP